MKFIFHFVHSALDTLRVFTHDMRNNFHQAKYGYNMNNGAIPHDLSKYITGLPFRTEIITDALFNSEIDGILCMQYIKLIYDLRDHVPGFTKAKVVQSTVS